ncbi:hypothetical protein ScPMuIL_006935 [Solemya velum]
MFNVAQKSSGAQVVLATSSDDKFPPENIIDGRQDTFWTSTGLFPQEFVISFASLMNVKKVKMICSNVRKLILEKSTDNEPINFSPLTERELENSEGHWQKEGIDLHGIQAHHVRVLIDTGFDHFVAVNDIQIEGNAVHG